MKAVILVGGLGTRLRPLTFSVPKPLLPVGETPILQIIIQRLRDCGIRELILATGYQAPLFHAYCGDGSKFGAQISYVHEDKPMGTAGPLSMLRNKFQEGERFVLMNGDILTGLDFKDFVDFSRRNDDDLTVGYADYVYKSPFGVLSIKEDKIVDVVEKPTVKYSISAGIYCVHASALEFVPNGEFFTIPDLVRKLIMARRRVGAYHITELWMGLESIADFSEALKELNSAPVPQATADSGNSTRTDMTTRTS
jgi:NDP-sugar pyrophosphorylase family protein